MKYENNKVRDLNIAYIGGGSRGWAWTFMTDLSMDDSLGGTIRLYDIDEAAAKNNEIIGNKLTSREDTTGKWDYVTCSTIGEALTGCDFVVISILPGTFDEMASDVHLPERLGIYQSVGDTAGPGGMIRALRTIPVMADFARDMEEVCPDALFLNYTNPMAMLTGAMLRGTGVKTVGLCHSVQTCAKGLLEGLGMPYDEQVQWKIAGINHQAWLLEIRDPQGNDLYPEIKRRALARTEKHEDMVRYEIMKRFGYYVTESSEHSAEYTPYFIKDKYPELIERFNIPLDEYPRRCIKNIEKWATQRDELTNNPNLRHELSREYASHIMAAMETNTPYKIGGNVINTGLITNLPQNACVEVPCLVDGSGVTPCYVGDLPEQCAALNRTNINVQLLTIEAAKTLKKDYIYQAALMDPHLQSELSIDDIVALCDDMIAAHEGWLPEYH